MKKILSIILCMSMFLTTFLVGCGNKNENAKNDTSNSSETKSEEGKKELKGEITFSTWGSLEEKKVNEEIIKAFEEKHPGTKVNLCYIPDEYTTKIETMFIGKNAPDVIYGHPSYFAKWAPQGLLMDLTEKFNETPELADQSKFNTQLYDAFKYEGKNIATVNGADTFLVYYNKDLFDQAGIDYPNADWTWEQLIEAAKKLTIVENGKPKQYGISVNEGLAQIFMNAFGGNLFDDMNNPTEVKANTEENIKALQFMQGLIYKDKCAPTSSDKQVLGGGFDSGKIAMVIDGVWSTVFRRNIKDFKWDLAELPASNGQRGTSCLYAGYAISKDTKNPDLAWEFAKFMESDEGQELLASCGLITVINKNIAGSDEVLKVEGAPEHHALRVSSLDYAINKQAMLKNWDEMEQKIIIPNMQLLLNNEQDAKTTADKIQKGLEELLKESK